MFLLRLLLGLLKGLIIGGLIGYGLAAAGMATPGAVVAYGAAAVVGIIVALVAGKPIWAKDSRIEVAMKAGAGALFGPGLLYLVRRFLTMDLPIDVSGLPGLNAVSGTPAIGVFAVTSLAAVAALLAGFFDADNQPEPEEAQGGAATTKKRVATGGSSAAEEEAAAAEMEAAEAEAARRSRK